MLLKSHMWSDVSITDLQDCVFMVGKSRSGGIFLVHLVFEIVIFFYIQSEHVQE